MKMTEKYYYENPKVSDTIIFDIYTPDANCCFNADPFEIVSLKIYFVERNFSTDFYTQVNANIGSPQLEKNYLEAAQNVCNDPNNLDYQNELKVTKKLLLNSANFSNIQFDNLIAIAVIGNEENPAWESSDPTKSLLYKITDIGSNIAFGHFGFKFKQESLREGDYFLVYNWRPNVSLQKLTSNVFFSLLPDSYKYITPANLRTDKSKYPELLNRYLPEVYKEKLSNFDLSPEVLNKFNMAVGDSFETIENLANSISGLIDYNLIPDYFLAYLGNFYRLNFYSNDTIKWRRQIAKAVPNFKMKGTEKGLKSALSDAGINLVKLTQLYQIYSKYIWTDVFYINDPSIIEFELSKISLAINTSNFEVYLRKGSGDFVQKSLNDISISTIQFVSILTWFGEPLKKGYTIKISYQIEQINNPVVQSLEDYLKTLPLADTRNDLENVYPPKNWNAKVIAENDPFFNELIPTKNPFHDPIVFGQIRTDFAYSENIYNMDEYNGSLRDSNNPCDIDKNFIDLCSGFATTLFNCDLTIEDLSPERINEALQIIKEYKPFHAVLHSLKYSGELNEYVLPPEENIEILINYYGVENVLANYPQMLFSRDMFEGLSSRKITRNMVANQTNLGTNTVQGFNQKIVLYSPLVDFSGLSIGYRDNTFLEILSPSPNQGTYTVINPQKNFIEIYEQALISQPINQSQFAYRLSLINYSGTNIDIKQKNIYVFSDPILKNSIIDYNVESKETNPANPWKIKYYTSYPSTFNVYEIDSINTDGSVVLKDDGSLPSLAQGIYVNNITYELLNSVNVSSYTSFEGTLFCFNNGIVTVNDGNFGNTKERLEIGDWLLYSPLSEQYQITEYGFENNVFVICSWNNGDVTGQSSKILSRIVKESTGNLSYYGMFIEKPASLPTIDNPNATNAVENNQFKENFILIIDNNLYKIEDYYTESSVEYLVLGGLKMDLTTQLAGGTSLSVQSIQLKKNNLSILKNQYQQIIDEPHLIIPTAQQFTEINLNKIPVFAGSVNGSIYFNEELIQRFSFDGSGLFKSIEYKYQASHAINGSIDYSTGVIVLTWNQIQRNVIFAINYQYSYNTVAHLCNVDRTGAVELNVMDENGNNLNLCQNTSFAINATLLSSLEKESENNKFNDIIKQEEKIGFKIETLDGKSYEGNLT